MPNRTWQVLLIGGNSGAGKSTIARDLGKWYDTAWLNVDDLRLTLESNTSAADRPALHLFDDLAQVYRSPPERVAEFRIANAVEVSRSIEIVIGNHIATAGPVILEGDDLVPSLATQLAFAQVDAPAGSVRAVYLIESDESVIEANMRSRERWFDQHSASHQRNLVRVSALYGERLRHEANALGLAVIAPRPYQTLAERIAAVLE